MCILKEKYVMYTRYSVDIMNKKGYNSINETYNTTDICNEKVITMKNGLLDAFFSKLDNFNKFAPKEVLEAFRVEFVPKFKNILENYDEEKMFNLLDDWFDTVDIYSNPETIRKLDSIDSDIEKGIYSEWNPQQNIG